jgi:hypothetical protein
MTAPHYAIAPATFPPRVHARNRCDPGTNHFQKVNFRQRPRMGKESLWTNEMLLTEFSPQGMPKDTDRGGAAGMGE